MDIPEDLGQRIVEATRLALQMHMQLQISNSFIPGGTGRTAGRACHPIGGADLYGGAAMDGGDLTPLPAISFPAGTLAERIASVARGGASAADTEAA